MKLLNFWRRFVRTAPPAPAAAQQRKPAPPSLPTAAPVHPQTDKLQRAETRDALAGALRETMLRAGILSSRYKARFLNISKHAEQYVVLCEIAARDLDGGHETLFQLEIALQQLLHDRMPLLQVQIYWRVHGHADKPAPPPALPPDFAPTQPMRHQD